jgi:hypothetical protein
MSPNRKAQIQRKLALAPVAKPPAGLADRIKRDIPKNLLLDTENERRRFSRSTMFNLRVAASIILLISSVYVCMTVLSRGIEEKRAIEHAEKVLNAPEATAPVIIASQPPSAAVAPPTAATRVATANRAPAAELQTPAPQVQKKTTQLADATAKPAKVEHAADTRAKAVAQLAEANDTLQRQVAAPSPAPAAPPRPQDRDEVTSAFRKDTTTQNAAAGAPAPEMQAAKEEKTMAAGAVAGAVARDSARDTMRDAARDAADNAPRRATAAMVPSAVASELSFDAPSTLFGINIVPTRSLLQRFAAPAKLPVRGVRVEADAAPAPFDATRQLLRVSIDMPAAELEPHAAVPPVGADATLTVEVDGQEPRTFAERVLIANTSVTALYDFNVDPDASRRSVIATVRLHYKSVRDGREQTITRSIRRGDVATSWDAASKRMKAASLAAAVGKAPSADVIAKATEAGLPELAAAAANR